MASGRKTIDDDIDALFQLPLADFIGGRKTLATRLKQDGRADEAKRVNALPKPAVSVWTVNQLYWRHRAQFDQLIAAGQRFRRAHTSRTGKPSELNEALGARREAISRLSDLASELLTAAGHNPALDTLRRIASTLEAISAYAVLPDDQAAGRLTKDLDPPGFESLAPFIRAVATTRSVPPASAGGSRLQSTANKPAAAATKTRTKSPSAKESRRTDETRQAKLIAAKASLQEAKKSLVAARTKAHTLSAAQKKADAEVKNADELRRKAEQRFKEASTVARDASIRAQNLAREAERAARALDEAERSVEIASKNVGSLS
jgi:hypothetical protein